MITSLNFPCRYIQGSGVFSSVLADQLSEQGRKGFTLVDPYVYKNTQLLPDLLKALGGRVQLKNVQFDGRLTPDSLNDMGIAAKGFRAHFVFGVGGGKAADAAKAVGDMLDIPVVVAPTIAASDAPCSRYTMITDENGVFDHFMPVRRNPDTVVVDTQWIAHGLQRHLIAGMGNALGAWFSSESCRKTGAPNISGFSSSETAYRLAWLCYENLLEYGVDALRACADKTVTRALDQIIETTILLSSIVYTNTGLASQHSIANSLTRCPTAHKYYYGERMAFATLVSLFLTEKIQHIKDDVYYFCEAVGLPTTFGEIGLSGSGDSGVLEQVVRSVCSHEEPAYHEPVPVTQEKILSALRDADREGARRKKGRGSGLSRAQGTFAH